MARTKIRDETRKRDALDDIQRGIDDVYEDYDEGEISVDKALEKAAKVAERFLETVRRERLR